MAKPVQTGKIAVICNSCNNKFEVPSTDYYRKGGLKCSCAGPESKGTLRTIQQSRPKTWKASRDRKAKGSQKG